MGRTGKPHIIVALQLNGATGHVLVLVLEDGETCGAKHGGRGGAETRSFYDRIYRIHRI